MVSDADNNSIRIDESLHQILARQLEVGRHVAGDPGQGADAKRVVVRDRDVVLAVLGCGQADVAPRPPRDGVALNSRCPDQLASRQAAREPHAEITSSRTKWRRITFGLSPSSK